MDTIVEKEKHRHYTKPVKYVYVNLNNVNDFGHQNVRNSEHHDHFQAEADLYTAFFILVTSPCIQHRGITLGVGQSNKKVGGIPRAREPRLKESSFRYQPGLIRTKISRSCELSSW